MTEGYEPEMNENEKERISAAVENTAENVSADPIPALQEEQTSIPPSEETKPVFEPTKPVYEAIDYKQSIRRLKAEYKQQKKEQKRQRMQNAYKTGDVRGGSRTGVTVLVSVVSTLVVLALAFGVLLYFPNPQQSYFRYLVKKYAASIQNPYPNQPDVPIGGENVSPGDQVTIEVNGELSAAAIYAKASKSVVGIEVRQLSGSKWEGITETAVSQGSGVVYSEDGMIITNFHVVEAAVNTATRAINSNYKVVVYFNTDLSEAYEVTSLLGYDSDNDLALLKVEAKGLHPMEFADSDELTVGEPVVAIGSPGGLEFMNSISEGIIGGLDRDITSSSNGVTVYELIQTTAAINPGNSGGALLNREGKLIGICVIKIVSEEYEGMGFAINSNATTRIVESILQYGRYVKPVLGVEVDTRYDADAASGQGWPAGAYVNSVTAGGPADRSGIRANDVICEIAGVRISSFSALRKQLVRCSPGDTITIKIYRTSTGEYLDMTVVLDAS